MAATARSLSAGLLVLALSGCAGHSHRLVSDNDSDCTTGSFSHGGSRENTMVLDVAGVMYEGRGFAIKRWQNLSELRKGLGPGKHYDQIVSGMDTDHVTYSAAPELRSENGDVIQCLFSWKAGREPSGICTKTDGTKILVRKLNVN